jgi:hypothetical protein
MTNRPRPVKLPGRASQSLPAGSITDDPAAGIPAAFRAARRSGPPRPAASNARPSADDMLDQLLPPYVVELRKQLDALWRAGFDKLSDDELCRVIAAFHLLSHWMAEFEFACIAELNRRIRSRLAAGRPLDAEIAALLTG